MKKLFLFFLLFLISSYGLELKSQTKEQIKARKEKVKETRKALNEKASKQAREEAKDLKKAGWMVPAGSLPMEKMLDRSYMIMYEEDEYFNPKYLIGKGQSIGGNLDGSKLSAIEMAKYDLTSQIESEFAALIENNVSNQAMSRDQATSLTSTIGAMKSKIVNKLGRYIPVIELYRNLPNGNKEVNVTIAYDAETARDMAKRMIYEELKEKNQKLQEELDQILDW